MQLIVFITLFSCAVLVITLKFKVWQYLRVNICYFCFIFWFSLVALFVISGFKFDLMIIPYAFACAFLGDLSLRIGEY